MTTGVLALQGAFVLHIQALARLGEEVVEVRTLEELAAVDRLIIPGGESSVMAMMAERSGLMGQLRERISSGMPTLGTCAGAILLATEVLDGRAGQTSLGVLDISVRRNAFGRQVDSFSTQLELSVESLAPGSDPKARAPHSESITAVFIRAPAIVSTGDTVDVLARFEDEPVFVRQGSVIATTFHPELSDDDTVHQLFLDL